MARRPAVETDPGLRASDADREQVVSRLREEAEQAYALTIAFILQVARGRPPMLSDKG